MCRKCKQGMSRTPARLQSLAQMRTDRYHVPNIRLSNCCQIAYNKNWIKGKETGCAVRSSKDILLHRFVLAHYYYCCILYVVCCMWIIIIIIIIVVMMMIMILYLLLRELRAYRQCFWPPNMSAVTAQSRKIEYSYKLTKNIHMKCVGMCSIQFKCVSNFTSQCPMVHCHHKQELNRTFVLSPSCHFTSLTKAAQFSTVCCRVQNFGVCK
jgi:hypothetical protein